MALKSSCLTLGCLTLALAFQAAQAEQPSSQSESATASAQLAFNETPPAPYYTGSFKEPVVDPSLWNRIRAGLRMAELDSPLIQVHADWYRNRPDYVARMLDRSRKYLFHIVEEVEARDMPMEVALLPMIESAFNPQAYSRSHAAGIWQFIPSTGKNYGLDQNHWYDGRRDVTAATRAALDYLQKLYMDFGDWQLALAAYNCGEGCVSRAVQKNAQRGLPTDFLSLSLPPETRHYVPKLMAIKQMVLNPESFGIALNEIPNEPYFTQVALDAATMDIQSAARLAGMSVDEFLTLNPAFPRKLIKTDKQVSVLVPVTHAEIFQNNLDKGEWDRWQPVTAKKGMSLEEIAQQLDTTPERIAEHNRLHLRSGRLVKDQVILAPINAASEEASVELEAATWQEATEHAREASGKPAQIYTVRRGGSLSIVAKKFGVSVANLKRWNKLRSTRLKAGQRLVVRPATKGDEGYTLASAKSVKTSKSTSSSVSRVTRYTVKRGDTLYSIANRFDVSVAQIKAWNKLRSASLPTGKKLTIKRS